MARPLRVHIPGKAYHLFARGDNKGAIFRDDTDCARFLEILAEALGRFAIQCLAYCLLRNHYHLLVIPQEHSVSRLLHQVNSTYCRRFNRRHHRVGHVLQGRFGSRIVDNGDYLLTVLRYIAMNPVEAGRVGCPEDWQWSSYRATAGLCDVPDFLTLDQVWSAVGCVDPREGRVLFVSRVTKIPKPDEPQKHLLLGGDSLKRRVHPLLQPHRDTRDFVYAERFATRPTLDELLIAADSRRALMRTARTAFLSHAYTLQEIADVVGRSPSTISRWVRQAPGVRS